MAQDQPPASPHPDPEDETLPAAKSAEDRKAAAALSKLDTHDDETAPAREVDQEAVKNAMSALGGPTPGKAGGEEKKEVKKVKVDAGDVALLVEELELSKAKATELLKAHDGDAVEAMKVYVTPVF